MYKEYHTFDRAVIPIDKSSDQYPAGLLLDQNSATTIMQSFENKKPSQLSIGARLNANHIHNGKKLEPYLKQKLENHKKMLHLRAEERFLINN